MNDDDSGVVDGKAYDRHQNQVKNSVGGLYAQNK